MDSNNYQDLLNELEGRVSIYKRTDKGFEIESNYFNVKYNEDLNNIINGLSFSLKNSINSLYVFLALYDARRTDSSKHAFLNQLQSVFDNCQSERDFLVVQSIFEQLSLVGGIAKEEEIILSSIIRIAKKKWQRGLTTNRSNNKNVEIEQFREKYHKVSELCKRVFNSSPLKEDELEDTIQQIDEIHNQFNKIFNQLSEPERSDIEQDIQDMLNSGANLKELIEEEKNLWSI